MYRSIYFENSRGKFYLGKGFPQGAISSPILFDLYIDSLLNRVLSYKGCKLILGYADDIIITGNGD